MGARTLQRRGPEAAGELAPACAAVDRRHADCQHRVVEVINAVLAIRVVVKARAVEVAAAPRARACADLKASEARYYGVVCRSDPPTHKSSGVASIETDSGPTVARASLNSSSAPLVTFT